MIDNNEPERNLDYTRQDQGGMITSHNGIADKLLKNDKLYNTLRGDWKRSEWNGNHNIKITTGREDGKFFITREQMNSDAIAEDAAAYRALAESGTWIDQKAPLMPDGSLGWQWVHLPTVVQIDILSTYFGGMSWPSVKSDRIAKAQFYMIVERDFPQYVTYPGGKLPLPIRPRYPSRAGGDKTLFYKGMN